MAAHLGGMVATVGFPNIGLQGFAPNPAEAGQGGNRVAVGPSPRRSVLIFPNSTRVRCNQFSSLCQKLRPRRPGAADDPRYFQISVPVQPGNSGGALVDERGNVIGIVSAKLNASAALAASGSLPENVNYAVKSSLLLSFLESVPAVSAKLKEPITADRKFADVVKSAQDAAVLVLVY